MGHLGEDGPEMMEQYLFQKGNKVFARSTLCDDDNEIILQYIYIGAQQCLLSPKCMHKAASLLLCTGSRLTTKPTQIYCTGTGIPGALCTQDCL